MIERYELRLFARYRDVVQDLLPEPPASSDGIAILRGRVGDTVFSRLADVEHQLRRAGLNRMFAGWRIQRSYTREELQRGELFLLEPPITHLSAEDYGTVYSESEACHQESFELELIDPSGSQYRLVPRIVPCSLCSQQAAPLHLPLRKLPRSRDIVRLFGGEIVISERLRSLLMSQAHRGSDLRPVLDSGKARSGSKSHNSQGPRQLTIHSRPVEVSKECSFGADPFDRNSIGSYRCSSGEIAGNRLLSALKVVRSSWDGSDFSRTRVYVGGRQGAFRPYQLLLVSKQLFHAMRRAAIKGFAYEVVELI